LFTAYPTVMRFALKSVDFLANEKFAFGIQ